MSIKSGTIKFFVVVLVILTQVVYAEAGTSTLEEIKWLDNISSVMSIYEKCPKHNVKMEKGGWVQVQGKYWLWGWICPLCEIEEKELIEIKTLDSLPDLLKK